MFQTDTLINKCIIIFSILFSYLCFLWDLVSDFSLPLSHWPYSSFVSSMMQGEVELHPTDPQKLSGSALLLGSPDEMKDEECGSACCRICLDENNDSGGGGGGYELISPCTCKGTQKFVHRSCLYRWRSVNDGGFAFSNCTTCNAQLHIPDEPFDDDNVSAWDVFLMWQFVSRSLFLFFLVAPVFGILTCSFVLDYCWQLYIYRLLLWWACLRTWWIFTETFAGLSKMNSLFVYWQNIPSCFIIPLVSPKSFHLFQ